MRVRELLPYLNMQYFTSNIKWMLVDKDKNHVSCAKCGNIANGVLVYHDAFNVPLCKSHYAEVYFKKHPESEGLTFPCMLDY